MVGMFFVLKKDGMLRLIIDSRPANAMFGAPPTVRLCSSEGLSRLEVDIPGNLLPGTPEFDDYLHQHPLFMAFADVDNCFHRAGMPLKLARYFCLQKATAEQLGILGWPVEDKVVQSGETLWPCWGRLPMGFSWSLFFMQTFGADTLNGIPGQGGDRRISDTSRGSL
jgi:hypothetical protein